MKERIQKEYKSYRHRLYKNYSNYIKNVTKYEILDRIRLRAPYVKRIINRFFPNNKDTIILDLGCGAGEFLYILREKGYTNFRGIEYSKDLVQQGKKIGIESINNGDIQKEILRFADSSFNVIIAFDIVEHFDKDEIFLLLTSIHRLLSKDGVLIVHTCNGGSIFPGRMRYFDFTHETSFTQASITQVLECIGFNKIECYEDTPVIHGVISLIRWILWKIIRLFFVVIIAAESGGLNRKSIFTQNFLTVSKK